MRIVVTFGVLGALSSFVPGCVEPPAPAPSLVRIGLDVGSRGTTDVCFAAVVRDDAGATVASVGDPASVGADRDTLRASGALCLADLAVPSVSLPCTPGASTGAVWVVGWFQEDGAPVEGDADPCGPDGCALAFTCVAHAETPVTWNLTLVRNAQQGFFDLDVRVDDPGAVKDLCMGFRVLDGNGVVVWADSGLCTSEYGNGRGDLGYGGTCSAEAADAQVTMWVEEPERPRLSDPTAAVTPWVNPCPGSTSDSDPLRWSGGCTRTVRCLENEDVTVDFDLRTLAPH
ncbi:MAG: hypothetical protein U1F43_33725 [Myxococcota bacterium]